MRKLTLLAIAAVLMLAQSSPALSSTFSGPYACRASGPGSYFIATAPPVMSLTANAGGTFSGGTLLYWSSGGLCEYSLNTSPTSSNFSSLAGSSGSAGSGHLFWENSITEPTNCAPDDMADAFGFVLSGLPSSGASANTVQLTDFFGPSWECTQK